MIVVIVLAIAIWFAQPALAQTTHVAASCERSVVAATIALATHGDTVLIPPGDCTWSSQVNVSVGITLHGAGQGSTILRDNIAKTTGVNEALFNVSVNSPNTFSLGQFTIIGVAPDTGQNKGHIQLYGTTKAFRVHHITFDPVQTAPVRTFGYLWGVIDHITMQGSGFAAFVIGHDGWGGSAFGDGSWAEALYWGTEKAIYIEDSNFSHTNNFVSEILDSEDGGRVVFRNNTLFNYRSGSHGTDSSQRRRSVRSMEIYNNTYAYGSSLANDFIHWFRGGTGVFYNNTITKGANTDINQVIKRANLRDTGSYAVWGICDGNNPLDQNTPGQTGYRCVDQPGSGTSNHLNGVTTPPATWVGNILDPIYVWGNTINGVSDNCSTWGCTNDNHVVTGRDMIVGTVRPSYSAFTYPHPLQTGSSTSASAVITSPVAGSSQSANSSFSVSGTATAGTGSLTRVDVYIDGTLACTDLAVPFTTWTCAATAPATPGSYTLTARATDSGGQGISSPGVGFIVPAPSSSPTAVITVPISSSSQTANSSFSVSGTATAGTGSLLQVTVYINGTQTCTDLVAPFTTWTCVATAPATPGSYTLTARATDSGGQGSASQGVLFTVPVGGPVVKWRLR